VTGTGTIGANNTGVFIGHPGDRVQVRWDDASFTILANTTVGNDGTFRVSFTVPANATAGAHAIAFVDLDFETGYVLGSPSFTIGQGTGQIRPEIVHFETFVEGVLVFFRLSFTDPSNTAVGFGFKGVNGSTWAEENHPFSSPSFGRVFSDRIEYPFNHLCGTPSAYESDVEAWIYDRAGQRTPSVTIYLACSAQSRGIFATPTFGYMGTGWTGDSAHRGIDIWTGKTSAGCVCSEPSGCATAPGNEVRAAYAGTVEAIYWGDHSGNWRLPNVSNPNRYPLSVVIIKHTNVPGVSGDIYTTYQHLANNETNESYVRNDLSIGDTVKQHEILGREGNWRYFQANDLITHLHFEVVFPVQNQPMPTRRTVDPMPYLSLNYASCSGNAFYP
jgi:murein DD-endopeptidase MepM/ murein hydrolase activator NlpD